VQAGRLTTSVQEKLQKILRMKRLFNPRKKSEHECPQEPGSTLDRIVKDKEGVKKRLEEEEKEFLSKKREYEAKMIEFEKQEVGRREQEIAERRSALQEMKRKNELVQDKVQEQIKTLTMKLEELRVEHSTNEASADSVISSLTDKLSEVRFSLSQRQENLLLDEGPTAPGEEGEEGGEEFRQRTLYPSLHHLPTMPRSWHQIYQATAATTQSSSFRSISLQAVELTGSPPGPAPRSRSGNSLGSSPQISLDSTTSSRSNTPKLDSDTSI